MELSISYYAMFGKCDSSEKIDYGYVKLNDEDSKAAMKYALIEDYDSLSELVDFLDIFDDLYKEIEEFEIENNLDMEDEYTLKCLGMLPMDEDELNDLVHSKDKHALEFFNLNNASDEEIEKWDANNLDEIPTIKEFTPNFEPTSPFDSGIDLNFIVDGVDISEEELIDYLKMLFKNNDLDTINEIVSDCTVEFDRDICDIILDVAKEMNCTEYIESSLED